MSRPKCPGPNVQALMSTLKWSGPNVRVQTSKPKYPGPNLQAQIPIQAQTSRPKCPGPNVQTQISRPKSPGPNTYPGPNVQTQMSRHKYPGQNVRAKMSCLNWPEFRDHCTRGIHSSLKNFQWLLDWVEVLMSHLLRSIIALISAAPFFCLIKVKGRWVCTECVPASDQVRTWIRVARFFLVQYTKPGTNVPNYHKICQMLIK
jgi:hypothetical protein